MVRARLFYLGLGALSSPGTARAQTRSLLLLRPWLSRSSPLPGTESAHSMALRASAMLIFSSFRYMKMSTIREKTKVRATE